MARGRKPSVRYWASRKGGGYFTTINGEQVELALGPDDGPNGPTFAAALAKFRKVLDLQQNIGTNSYLVSALFNKYREHLAAKDAEYDLERLFQFERHAQGFADLYGKMKVEDLRVYHFDEWWARMPTWGSTTRHHAGRHIVTCLNWGVKKGYIVSNPVDGRLQLPEPQRRGKESRLPDELCRLLIGLSHSKEFRLFQNLLWMTGARPVELRNATARNYRKGKIIFSANPPKGAYRHKTIRTKRDRVIYLPPELVAEVEEVVTKHPEGPIFRSPRGKPWTRANLHRTWKTLLEHEEIRAYCREHDIDLKKVTPYCYRHGFLSQWIDSGRSIHVAAELCGTSVQNIERIYGHADMEKMHQHYEAFLQHDWPSRPQPTTN